MEVKEELYKAADRIECVDYRSAERSGEIEEALDSCVTRVSFILNIITLNSSRSTAKHSDTVFHLGTVKTMLKISSKFSKFSNGFMCSDL